MKAAFGECVRQGRLYSPYVASERKKDRDFRDIDRIIHNWRFSQTLVSETNRPKDLIHGHNTTAPKKLPTSIQGRRVWERHNRSVRETENSLD